MGQYHLKLCEEVYGQLWSVNFDFYGIFLWFCLVIMVSAIKYYWYNVCKLVAIYSEILQYTCVFSRIQGDRKLVICFNPVTLGQTYTQGQILWQIQQIIFINVYVFMDDNGVTHMRVKGYLQTQYENCLFLTVINT